MSPPRPKGAASRCPICGRAREKDFKPFCSKHCADVDLARWLGGRYTIAGKQSDEDDAEQPARPLDTEE